MRPFYVLTSRTSAAAQTAYVNPYFNAAARKFGRFLPDTQVTASFSINADGSCSIDEYGSPSTWATPVGGSYGGSYWAIVTLESGTPTSGTTGSRVSLATGYRWTATTSGYGEIRRNAVSGTIQIWDAAAAGNMVASGTFVLDAQVDNTVYSSSGGDYGNTEDFEFGSPLQKY